MEEGFEAVLTQICVAVNLFRAVRAKHSSADDNRINLGTDFPGKNGKRILKAFVVIDGEP
jgi:hypothetical protein